MESYHETTALSNPYAYEVIPPIGRLLDCLCERLSVGGCFRPGNRQLADWLGYASAGQIPYLLSQLACDGWIDYDRDSRLITLLRTPESDLAIGSPDRLDSICSTDQRSDGQIESRAIDRTDRGLPQQDAVAGSDLTNRSIPQRMEDSYVTTTSSHSSLVVVTKENLPCGAETISAADHPIAVLLAELRPPPGRGVLERVLAARDWTPQQVRERWEYDGKRIAASDGRLTWGVFWTALMAGELAPARRDTERPIEPASYANVSGFQLGSAVDPGGGREEALRNAHWRARQIAPRGTGFAAMAILVNALADGLSDEQALDVLATEQRGLS